MASKIVLAGLLVAASFPAAALPDEELCLQIGDLSFTIAQQRASGVSEKETLALFDAARENSARKLKTEKDVEYNRRIFEWQKLVAKYVYTTELPPPVARKMVYLKCKLGDFPLD